MKRLILTVLFASVASAANFPDRWPRCKLPPSEGFVRSKCLQSAVNGIVKELGDAQVATSLGLDPLEPFRLKTIVFGEAESNGPVGFRMELKDIELRGLPELVMNYAEHRVSLPRNWTVHLRGDLKRMTMLGKYGAKGRILLFPINSAGIFNFTFLNVKADSDLSARLHTKNGKEHLKVTDSRFQADIGDAIMNVNNLLASDKALEEVMNRIMNDNWRTIFSEVKPFIENQLRGALTKYCKTFMAKFPYSEIVLPEGS